jgi:hypothetical protein
VYVVADEGVCPRDTAARHENHGDERPASNDAWSYGGWTSRAVAFDLLATVVGSITITVEEDPWD